MALHFAERASLPETWITAPPPLKAKFPTSLIFHPSGRRSSQRHAGCHCSPDKRQNAASLSSQVSALCVDGRLSLDGTQRWSDGAARAAAKTPDSILLQIKDPVQSKCSTCNGASDLIISQRIIHEKMMLSMDEDDKTYRYISASLRLHFFVSAETSQSSRQDFILSDPS